MHIKYRLFPVIFLLLAFGLIYGAQASTTVQRPDQYFTLGVYRSAAMDRVATAEITKFERCSANGVAWMTPVGAISGDIVGTTTMNVEEYDIATDTIYKTKIHVTVVPHDKAIDIKLDPETNSGAVKDFVQKTGYYFPVGMQYSVKTIYTKNGVKLPVSYKSNRPSVATVDQNGTVTMHSAGTAVITVTCNSLSDSQTMFVIVYDENSGGSLTAGYEPQDKDQKLNVYKSADAGSQVVATLQRFDFFYIFSKNAVWTRVCFNGIVGYVQTSSLSFYPNAVWPTLEAGATADADAVDKAAREAGDLPAPAPTPNPVSGEAAGQEMVIQTGNSGKLHLRKSPVSSGTSLGLYENGTQVTILRDLGEWVQVSVMGKAGYMMAKFLAAGDDAAAPEASKEPAASGTPEPSATPEPNAFGVGATLYVQTGNDGKLNLRARASSSATSVERYANGTKATVLGVYGAWLRVQVNSRTGYMMKQYLSPEAPAAATSTPAPEEGSTATPAPSATPEPSITPEPDALGAGATLYVKTGNDGKLNLRAKASSSSSTVERYANGTPVTVLSRSGAWMRVRVQTDNRTGYMLLQYLSQQEPQAASSPTATASPLDQAAPEPAGGTMLVNTENDEKLHLRAKPSTSSVSLDRYPNGTQVTVLGRTGEWAKVRVNGRTGYMMLAFLKAE